MAIKMENIGLKRLTIGTVKPAGRSSERSIAEDLEELTGFIQKLLVADSAMEVAPSDIASK